MIKTADELLMLAASYGGRVVSSGDLTLLQIAHAQAFHWYVNDQGFGFAVLPWDLATSKDKEREAGGSAMNRGVKP